MNKVYIPHNWASGKPLSTQPKPLSRKHVYVVRAFDKNHTYVIHKKIEGREAVRIFKREARKQHKHIAYFRVYDETSQRTVER